MPRTTPGEVSRRTLLVLKNMVMKLTAFLPTSCAPPMLCVQRIGWTLFGWSEWFRVYARCTACCEPFVVCFKMGRMYALYLKNGHALNSVTGDTVEDPLKDTSRSSPVSLAPPVLCVQRIRQTVLGHGCDLAFCPGTTPSGGQLRCVEFEARRALSGFKVPYFAFGTTRGFVTIVPSGLPSKQFGNSIQLLSEFKRRHSAASQRGALRGTGLCCPPPWTEPLRQCHRLSKKQPSVIICVAITLTVTPSLGWCSTVCCVSTRVVARCHPRPILWQRPRHKNKALEPKKL